MNQAKPTEVPQVENDLVEQIPAEWRQEYLRFITVGDASDAFLEFLDRHVPTQQAVEAALADKMRNFERFVEDLHLDPDVLAAHLKRYDPTPTDIVRETSAKLKATVRRWLSLPPRQKREIARDVCADHDVAVALDELKQSGGMDGTSERQRR